MKWWHRCNVNELDARLGELTDLATAAVRLDVSAGELVTALGDLRKWLIARSVGEGRKTAGIDTPAPVRRQRGKKRGKRANGSITLTDSGRFMLRMSFDGKVKYMGTYDTEAQAQEVADAARKSEASAQ